MKEYFQSSTATTPTVSGTCPTPGSLTDADIETVYSNGIITTGLVNDTSLYDTTGNKLKNVASYVQTRTGASYLEPRANVINDQGGSAAGGAGAVTYTRENLAAMVSDDMTLINNLKNEYCHYNARYTYVLNKFLTSITSSDATTKSKTQDYLTKTIKLNRRLNAMLEIMDYLGRQRVSYVNDQSASIDATGQAIGVELPKLQAVADQLNSKNAILETQQEMMRFTQEKNNHIRNQISLWASLNILALGVIFYVYRRI